MQSSQSVTVVYHSGRRTWPCLASAGRYLSSPSRA